MYGSFKKLKLAISRAGSILFFFMRWYSSHMLGSVIESWLVNQMRSNMKDKRLSVFLLSQNRLELCELILLWMLPSFKTHNVFFFFPLIKPDQREGPAYVARAFNYFPMVYLHVKLSPNELSWKKTVKCVEYYRQGVAHDRVLRNNFLRRLHILLFIETCLLWDHSQQPGFTAVV